MNKSFYIITLGCQMNVHESEKIAGYLHELGYTQAKSDKDASIVVFNTCCIREMAENKAKGQIGSFKKRKTKDKDFILAVGGCMPQQAGKAEELMKLFPFIDIIFGTQNLCHFGEFLKTRLETNKKAIYIENGSPLPIEHINQILRQDEKNAYVSIMYGCNNFCTYCIVPYVRGRERSRSPQDIFAEVEGLAKENKYKTITLLGQNVNSYGKDLACKTDFTKLLKSLCTIEGNHKIAFLTSHPKDMCDSLIESIKDESKILRDIHVPIQSGSSKILRGMNRGYTREQYLTLAKKLRAIDGVRLSTDIIVGFPGETEQDFNDTLEIMREIKFDNIYAFMYSPRSGTQAATMTGHIEQKEKKRRINALFALQRQIEKTKKCSTSV